MPFFEVARVTLGVEADTGTGVVRTMEEVAAPAPLGLGTSNTVSRS